MLSPLYTSSRTLDAFWKLLVWSFKWLQLGRWPTEDSDGRAFTEGEPGYERAGELLAGGFSGC
eukprot:6065655-Alexandrium_andersonii.AAC.1